MMDRQFRDYYFALLFVLISGIILVFMTAKIAVPTVLHSASGLKITPSMVVFTSLLNGDYDLFAYDLDTRLVVNLTQNPDSSEVFPAWSHDGNQLAFSKCGKPGIEYIVGGCVIHIWRPDEALQQLTYPAATEDDRQALWSPDDTRLAFFRRHGNDQELYVIKADGSNLQELCGGATRCDDMVWSPDSQKLFFVNATLPYIAHLNTGTLQQLELNRGHVIAATWSPDSRQIVYGKTVPPRWKYDLFVLDVATGVERQLTTGAHKIMVPAWSADGQQITFTANFERRPKGILENYRINVDGTNLEFIGKALTLGGHSTAWSPDQKQVLFSQATRYMFPEVYESELYLANADGTNRQRLLVWAGSLSDLQWRPRNS